MKDHGLRLQMRALCKQLGFELREYTATSGPWVDVERKENGDVPELQRRVASLMSDNKRLQERFDALLAHLGVRVELVCDRLTLFHGVPPKYAVLQVPLSAEAAADKALEETHGIDTDDPAVRSAAVYAAKLARGEQ